MFDFLKKRFYDLFIYLLVRFAIIISINNKEKIKLK